MNFWQQFHMDETKDINPKYFQLINKVVYLWDIEYTVSLKILDFDGCNQKAQRHDNAINDVK